MTYPFEPGRIRGALIPGAMALVTGLAVFAVAGAARADEIADDAVINEIQVENMRPAAQAAGSVPAVNDEDEEAEEIVVTGSRIRRDEYTTAAPLQTFDVDQARQIGISNVTELLQRTTIAGGRQINGTVNQGSGFTNATEPPPPGGMGSANLSLRGLDPERTLILVNGKRIGAASAGGAPAQPDINLLPLNMVENIEVITEGASAVYGADAVAGVVNVLLRDDFEGMELFANGEIPFDGGGEIKQFSMIAGTGKTIDDLVACVGRLPDASIFAADVITASGVPTIQAIFRRGLSAAESDLGIANFSTPNALPDSVIPPNRVDETASGGGRDNFDIANDFLYTDTEERLEADLVQPITRFSLVTMGSYRPDWQTTRWSFISKPITCTGIRRLAAMLCKSFRPFRA